MENDNHIRNSYVKAWAEEVLKNIFEERPKVRASIKKGNGVRMGISPEIIIHDGEEYEVSCEVIVQRRTTIIDIEA